MKIIANENFAKERALYNLKDTELNNVTFKGVEDGESALKEAKNININKCLLCMEKCSYEKDKNY